MAQPAWYCQPGLPVAVRGVADIPLQGIVLEPIAVTRRSARPLVAVAVKARDSDEWRPLVASPHQLLMTWERWCALRAAALAGDRPSHLRLVEIIPEGTRRALPHDGIEVRSVLVVDATPSLQRIAERLLPSVGFRVEVFETAAAAIRRSAGRRPDLVVLEPHGTRLEALATLRQLRLLHGDGAPPVIWCTSVIPAPSQVEKGARLGLRGVILKPLQLDSLATLALRVCRDAEREHRLVAMGVPSAHLATRSLDEEETRLWVRAETELRTAGRRPLSLVWVGVHSAEVLEAIRGVIRVGDMLGRGPDGSLLILLPDVDETGARAVGARIRYATSVLEHRPLVSSITCAPEDDVLAVLARHIAEARSLV
jgi:two-component system chemotaxis response regulator CheY